jgi:hypothetical protein
MACSEKIFNLIKSVYNKVGSLDPMAIAKAYKYNIIYRPIGPMTLGTRIQSCRKTTIILDDNLQEAEQILVPLHEIKHCLMDKGVGTPFLRRYSTFVPISKRESEANEFAMNCLAYLYSYDLENLTKYQICDYFNLDYYWSNFI